MKKGVKKEEHQDKKTDFKGALIVSITTKLCKHETSNIFSRTVDL